MKQDRNIDGIYPDGKIMLMDGRFVDCYPIATDEPDSVVDDTLGIDLTGQHSSPKRKGSAMSPENQEENRKLFTDNAFYLLAHIERILTDSRMFLCPIPVQNGLAISGTSGFKNPVLGVYLQWWQSCPGAKRTDKRGRHSLVYHLAGSGLSSGNRCSEVYEDGSTQKVWLETFRECCRSFIKINNAYNDAKQRYQAYTLKQVLDILKHEENGGMGYDRIINEQFYISEINRLNTRLHYLNMQNKALEERYKNAMLKWKEEKIIQYYEDYQKLKARIEPEIALLSTQKRELKQMLHQGIYTNKDYQPLVALFNRRIQETEAELRHFKYEEINRIFPNDSINFTQIEEYVNKLNVNGNKTDNM